MNQKQCNELLMKAVQEDIVSPVTIRRLVQATGATPKKVKEAIAQMKDIMSKINENDEKG